MLLDAWRGCTFEEASRLGGGGSVRCRTVPSGASSLTQKSVYLVQTSVDIS